MTPFEFAGPTPRSAATEEPDAPVFVTVVVEAVVFRVSFAAPPISADELGPARRLNLAAPPLPLTTHEYVLPKLSMTMSPSL